MALAAGGPPAELIGGGRSRAHDRGLGYHARCGTHPAGLHQPDAQMLGGAPGQIGEHHVGLDDQLGLALWAITSISSAEMKALIQSSNGS